MNERTVDSECDVRLIGWHALTNRARAARVTPGADQSGVSRAFAAQTDSRAEREQHEEVHRGAQATGGAAVAPDGRLPEGARRPARPPHEGVGAGERQRTTTAGRGPEAGAGGDHRAGAGGDHGRGP